MHVVILYALWSSFNVDMLICPVNLSSFMSAEISLQRSQPTLFHWTCLWRIEIRVIIAWRYLPSAEISLKTYSHTSHVNALPQIQELYYSNNRQPPSFLYACDNCEKSIMLSNHMWKNHEICICGSILLLLLYNILELHVSIRQACLCVSVKSFHTTWWFFRPTFHRKRPKWR